jgi:hypothetical protein
MNIKIRNDAIVAFTVAFFYLLSLGYAAAYEYDSCPDSVKVDNAWWSGTDCEGGLYDSGTLYMKWSDAPFTNESVEVTSVTLTVSGVSQGTDVYVYFWVNSRWYRMSLGTIDFSGDYVYELPYNPGPYMDSSMRIKVINRGSETLQSR